MREIKFRYLVDGQMVSYTLYQLIYGFMDKGTLHPEDYRGIYTGLKDKNGVERCEGDIIRRQSGYKFVEELKSFSMGSPTHAQAYGYNFHPTDEVIGNIYENPELLTP